MDDVLEALKQWKLDLGAVRQQVYRAPTPRERERWQAVWLLAGGWTATQVAEALERDPHTLGEGLATLRQAGPAGLRFEPTGGSPPPSPTRNKPSCRNYLHRLGCVLKRPKQRLVKADAAKRAVLVREYALLRAAAQASGAKLLLADEAHF